MQGASLALHLLARRAIRTLAGACSEPAQRANKTSGHVGNKIGTPLKTAVTESRVDYNTGARCSELRLRFTPRDCLSPFVYASGLRFYLHLTPSFGAIAPALGANRLSPTFVGFNTSRAL